MSSTRLRKKPEKWLCFIQVCDKSDCVCAGVHTTYSSVAKYSVCSGVLYRCVVRYTACACVLYRCVVRYTVCANVVYSRALK